MIPIRLAVALGVAACSGPTQRRAAPPTAADREVRSVPAASVPTLDAFCDEASRALSLGPHACERTTEIEAGDGELEAGAVVRLRATGPDADGEEHFVVALRHGGRWQEGEADCQVLSETQDCAVDELRFGQLVPGGPEEAILRMTWTEKVGEDFGSIECFERYERATFVFVFALRDGVVQSVSFPERYQLHDTARTCEPGTEAGFELETELTEAGELVVRPKSGLVVRTGATGLGELGRVDAVLGTHRLENLLAAPR